jgi:phosphorylcholine metabolism protein LicD
MDDKKALQEITRLLSEKGIPFWVDCGTCLGAYRYGGIIPWDNDLDLAAIKEDFENIMHALQALDETKYVVQDWSNRCRPGTYIRVYIKSNRNHIDIYLSAIDAENETLTNILSYGESHFMAESWKIRERMFGKPVPFDVIFPLKKAKFDGIDIPVPNQIEVYLSYKYGPNISPVMIYNEATDHYEKDLSHPYWGIPLVH